MFLQILHNYIT